MRRAISSSPARLAALLLILTAAFSILDPTARAQFAARVSGTVTDASGAGISNASGTLLNPAPGEQRTTATGATGFYEFSELSAGNCTMTVAANGFKSVTYRAMWPFRENCRVARIMVG
jgi:hypothetical protein